MFYIYIDESGVGKKEGKTSIALVYLHVEDVDYLNRAVLEVEQLMNIDYFHWAHAGWNVRKQFIEAVCRESFSVKIALFTNPFMGSSDFENAIANLITENNISKIIIDGKKSRKYERRMKKILKLKMIHMKQLRTGNDQAYPALRVADAIAGLVRYTYEHGEVKEVRHLYRIIHKKIRSIVGD
ncbi:MAG: DUF3800 domain-containing protein [Candidatus Taylorbacteria bacterium]